MTNLIQADLFRIRKSKLTLVMMILCVVVPLVICLLYTGVVALLDFTEDVASSEEMADFAEGFQMGFESGMGDAEMDPHDLFTLPVILSSAFSLSNNLGLVFPIFAGLLVCGDLTGGTLRSKLISGSSRTKVYLSHLITAGIFAAVMAALYAAFTLLFGFLFFDYGEPITKEVVLQLVRWAVMGILTFVFASTISTLLALGTGSTGGTIIFTMVTCLVLQILAVACGVFADFGKSWADLLFLVPLYGSLQSIALGWKEFGMSIGSYAVFGALNTLLGILIFRRKELK